MAAATGMSQSAISRIWRALGLKPHLVQTRKLSADPRHRHREFLRFLKRIDVAVPNGLELHLI